MQIPWYLSAIGAALIWGIHYPLIDNALKKISLFSVLLLTVLPVLLLSIFYIDEIRTDYRTIISLPNNEKFKILAIGLTSVLASLLLFQSIGSKNATFASLIEITYPIFVALFTYLIFKHTHLSYSIGAGGMLILIGASIIILNNP